LDGLCAAVGEGLRSLAEWISPVDDPIRTTCRQREAPNRAHRSPAERHKSLRVLHPGGTAIGLAGPPDPDFARRQGLRLPLRLAITGLSLKTRLTARRHRVRHSFLLMHSSGAPLDEITQLIQTNVVRPGDVFSGQEPPDTAPIRKSPPILVRCAVLFGISGIVAWIVRR
jgi:hypothetical protein